MRYYDWFLDLCGTLTGILILLISIGIGVDVGFRIVQGQGLYWLIDLVEYALLLITFLGAPWVLRRGGHVAVDVVLMALPQNNIRIFIRRAMAVVAAAICGMMAFIGFETTAEAYQRGALIFKSLIFPEWWILVVMPLSMLLCAIEFLRQAWQGDPVLAQLSDSNNQDVTKNALTKETHA